MKRILLLAGLLVLVGSATGTEGGAGSAAARPAVGPGTIVFISNRDGDDDVYAVNPDGTGLTQLTHTRANESSPIPSPDGSLIAYQDQSNDATRLMNADGSGGHALKACESVSSEAWSPDSQRIVCSHGYEKGLVVVDVASGTARTLVRSGREPSWSPDGSTIAFDDQGLWAVPAEGGSRRRLGRRKVADFEAPSWSPDSQRLAYAGLVGEDRIDLFMINADGSGGQRLASRIADLPRALRWSPAGSLIAFVKELPPYALAVYVARADGGGVQRISVSAAGESSIGTAWSADGTALLFERARYREAETADIYLAVVGGESRALTHPFPAGGTNTEPSWLPGPPLSGREPVPPTVTLAPAREVTFADTLEGVASDGRRAVPKLPMCSCSNKHAFVWDAVSGSKTRIPPQCPSTLVLAGRRVAWACADRGNTFLEITVEAFVLGSKRPTVVASSYADEEGRGDEIGNLVGHGGTIAFTNFHGRRQTRHDAWLLLPGHGRKCPDSGDQGSPRVCRRLSHAGNGITMSADAGRVLVVAPSGVVRLLSTQDRVLRTWRLGRGIVNARVRGRTLAVQRSAMLDVFDTVTGAKTQSRPLAADEGLRPLLLDVQGDLVAYATGGAIHLLRLSDGLDRALDLPGAAPWLDARLEAGGLFVSWNKMYDPRPGHLDFVPMQTIIEGFTRQIGRPS